MVLPLPFPFPSMEVPSAVAPPITDVPRPLGGESPPARLLSGLDVLPRTGPMPSPIPVLPMPLFMPLLMVLFELWKDK